jgi:hypothetical protein
MQINSTREEPKTPEPFVDVEKAADFLSITPRHLQELARGGIAGAYAIGTDRHRKTWRFKLSELNEGITRRWAK